jgi:DNA adenine methylase
MKSPLNYLGGKSRLVKRIVPMIPTDHVCYCEPFCGGAWVLFGKDYSKQEVINDLDRELVNFWRVIQNHLEEFLRYFKHAVISREIFALENRKDPTTLTDIQRATRYYYLQRLSFGGRTTGRTFGTGTTGPAGLDLTTIQERIYEVNWRIKRVTIENLPALECIRRYDRPDTFFYIDPPYWHTAGYAVPWTDDDFLKLRDLLLTLKGRFILSINDTPEIRRIFRAFKMKKVATTYSVANTRGADVDRGEAKAELLIYHLSRKTNPRSPA